MFQDLQITRDRYNASQGTYQERPTLIARSVSVCFMPDFTCRFCVRFDRYQKTIDADFRPYKNTNIMSQHLGPVTKAICSRPVAKATVDSLSLPYSYQTFMNLFSNGTKADCPKTAYTGPARQLATCLQAWEDQYTREGHKLDELDLDLVDQTTRSTDIDGCNTSSYVREFLSNGAPQLWWTRALDGRLCFVLGHSWMPRHGKTGFRRA